MVYLFEFANDAFSVLHCDAASVYCGGLLRVCAADAFTSFLLISDDDLSFIFFSLIFDFIALPRDADFLLMHSSARSSFLRHVCSLLVVSVFPLMIIW